MGAAKEAEVRGVYHRDLYDASQPVASWWEASAPAGPPRPALQGDHATDVAIVGAGYAGLSCALRLAERGIGAVALDSGAVGWGASGRNGGFVGLDSDMLGEAGRIARFGEAEARACADAFLQGAERLATFCAARGIETQGRAETLVAPHARAFATMKAAAAAHRFGPAPEVVTAAAYGEQGFDGPLQHGALRLRPGFALHPLALARALAEAAEAAGAGIFERSEVLAWRREGAAHLLETAQGALRARRVVLATNGFTPDALHPAFAGRTIPVLSMIGVTRPLTEEERAAHRWREDGPVVTARRMLHYYRMLPQGRLLFGMRGDLSGADATGPAMRRRIGAEIAALFPLWAGVEIEFFWRGPICATGALRPGVGRLTEDASVHHAFGWHGSGVNGAQVAGRLLADVIAGAPETAIPAPLRGLPPRIPLPGLRRLWVGAAVAGFRALDAWEAR